MPEENACEWTERNILDLPDPADDAEVKITVIDHTPEFHPGDDFGIVPIRWVEPPPS